MSPVRAGPRQALRVQRVDLVPGGGRGSCPEKAGVRTPAKQAVGESASCSEQRSENRERKRQGGRGKGWGLKVMHGSGLLRRLGSSPVAAPLILEPAR